MPYDLSDYKTVAERITEAKEKYPEGRFQTEVLFLADHPGYVAVKARFFRTPDDPTPGEGVAWEVVPGRTPYTKDSELQNAETSAWGRALVGALVVDTSKGIASRDEVLSRRPEPPPRQRSGGRRGPSTEAPYVGVGGTIPKEPPVAPENPSEAPRADPGNGVEGKIRELKQALLDRVNGDKVKAAMVWRLALENFGLDPKEPPPADMLAALEANLGAWEEPA